MNKKTREEALKILRRPFREFSDAIAKVSDAALEAIQDELTLDWPDRGALVREVLVDTEQTRRQMKGRWAR